MAITVDVSATFDEFWDVTHGSTSPWTKSVAAGSPEGVVVALTTGGDCTSIVSSITYGGVALTKLNTANDTASELTSSQWWILESGVPSGTRDCIITLSDVATIKRACCITLNSTTPSVTFVVSAEDEENQANSSVALDSGADSAMRFVALAYGGLTAAVTAGTGVTRVMGVDSVGTGTISFHVGHETTASAGNTSVGFTHVSDDVALAGIAVKEGPAAGKPIRPPTMVLQAVQRSVW